jgi:hypothetical protein
MKKATENFYAIEQRLGSELFNQIYKNDYPKTFDIVDENDDEICILLPFEFYLKGTQLLKVWTKKVDYIIS